MRLPSLFCLACFATALPPGSAATPDMRIIQAVKDDDLPAVRSLLKVRVTVNVPEGDGATALHWAAYRDNVAIADLLIRSGAHVNAANDDGATPLELACMNRSAAMVDRLVSAGANVNAKMINGETVLMTCARTGNPEAVKALLIRGADVNARELSHDQTALMWAASEQHPAVVQLLIDAHADVRARSRSYPQTVVNVETQKAGREKLNYTMMRGGSTPLLFASRVGDLESAKLLVAAGADVNDSLPNGTSALVLAAHSGNEDVGIFLAEKGANPNACEIGYAALHAAILRNELKLVKTLLAHGADPNLRITKGTPLRRSNTDYNLPETLIGATPYLLAAKFLEAGIMRALAAGGADPKLTMPNGATALMLAAGMGSTRNRNRRGLLVIDEGGNILGTVEPENLVLEAVTAAVTLGADVNATNSVGDAALHAAATLDYDSVIQYLVDHGARLNVKNKSGKTPLALLSAQPKGAADGADLTGVPDPVNKHASTVALLRKLGAAE